VPDYAPSRVNSLDHSGPSQHRGCCARHDSAQPHLLAKASEARLQTVHIDPHRLARLQRLVGNVIRLIKPFESSELNHHSIIQDDKSKNSTTAPVQTLRIFRSAADGPPAVGSCPSYLSLVTISCDGAGRTQGLHEYICPLNQVGAGHPPLK
jgi:hypothetical protein